MFKEDWVCAECGGDNVEEQVTGWRYVNDPDGVVDPEGVVPVRGRTYCNDCDYEDVGLILEEEWHERNKN